MRIEIIYWSQNRIWAPKGRTENARRWVAMNERMSTMLKAWCGSRKEGWVYPSSRSKPGLVTTIAKGLQAARERAGFDKKWSRIRPFPPTAHTPWKREQIPSRSANQMGHADLKSMQPHQHQKLEPWRVVINQRNQRKDMVNFLVKFWNLKHQQRMEHIRKMLDRIEV